MYSLMRSLLPALFVWVENSAIAQNITGLVQHNQTPIEGVYIYWKGATEMFTTTDSMGKFSINKHPSVDTLIASSVGYQTAQVYVGPNQQELIIELKHGALLEGVTVTEAAQAKSLDPKSARQTIRFSEKEFTKAACCNLSESFENISAVDVATSDAVTGIKQIQMMGFSGIYVQTMVDNMPYAFGLHAASGLTYIPGVFVKGMQLSKGVGSVVNGYDGMTGSLNIELRKPYNRERLIVNGYFNPMNLRSEANVIFTHQWNQYWASTTMIHGSAVSASTDVNQDGIEDFPQQENVKAEHMFMFMKDKWEAVFGYKYVNYNQSMKSLEGAFAPETPWSSLHTDRKHVAHGMIGYNFSKEPLKSMGFRFNATQNQLVNSFTNRNYLGEERVLNAKWVYQSILGNTFHKYTVGLSFYGNQTDEMFADLHHTLNLERREYVPGVFAEYTESGINNMVIVAGFRVDQHSYFGTLYTPRLHIKYNLGNETELRLGTGRGQRTSNPFADYQGLLSTGRRIVLPDPNAMQDGYYGLQQEVSWNSGIALSRCFKINNKQASISLDYYYTFFDEQLQVDRDFQANEIHFYNLSAFGLNSYSHSASLEMDYAPTRRFEIRAAYRFIDSRSEFQDGLLRMNPLISPHRAFLNGAYETRNNWNFDLTVNWQSPKRLPQGNNLPEFLQNSPEWSPSYTAVMAQILKKFGKSWEVYIGGENLLNIRQDELIRLASTPESPFFDPTMIWGPSLGAMFYMGFRYYVR